MQTRANPRLHARCQVWQRRHCGLYAGWLISLLALMWCLPGAAPAATQEAAVTIEAVPASVALSAQQAVSLRVVLRNQTPDAVRNITLSWFSDLDNLSLAITPAAYPELAAQSTLVWSIDIAPYSDRTMQISTLHLIVTYERDMATVGAADVTATQVIVEDVEVQILPATPLSELIRIEIQASPRTLQDQQAEQIYLTITNMASFPLTLSDIRMMGPSFIRGEIQHPSGGTLLPPQQTHVVTATLHSDDTVQTGEHVLLFEHLFAWQEMNQQHTGSVVAVHTLQVGVLAESELLTLLQIPSLIVLPGFLIVATFGIVYRLIPHSKGPDLSPFLEARSLEFWVAAITLAGTMGLVIYPWITGIWTGSPRDYLRSGYGVYDIVFLWVVSVFLGPVLYMLYRLFYWWWSSFFVFQPSETPLQALRKVYRRSNTLSKPAAQVDIDEHTYRVYLLEPLSDTRSTLWMAPPIQIRWRDQADEHQVMRQIEHTWSKAERKAPGSVCWIGRWWTNYRLVTLLDRAQRRGLLQISWMPQGDAPHQVWPQQMPCDTIDFLGRSEMMIHQADE